PCLVRSTNFTYDETPVVTYLTAVQQVGYIRNAGNGTYSVVDPVTGEVLSPKALPPVELEYSRAVVDDTVRIVDAASTENAPNGIDGWAYRWVDLDSEGLSGILTEQAGAWF